MLFTLLFWGTMPMWAFPVTWVLYVFTMMLKRYRDERRAAGLPLHWWPKYVGGAFIGIGLVLDLYLNIVTMSILLLEAPKFELTTARLTRWNQRPNPIGRNRLYTWRWTVCRWACKNLLEPFDEGHCS